MTQASEANWSVASTMPSASGTGSGTTSSTMYPSNTGPRMVQLAMAPTTRPSASNANRLQVSRFAHRPDATAPVGKIRNVTAPVAKAMDPVRPATHSRSSAPAPVDRMASATSSPVAAMPAPEAPRVQPTAWRGWWSRITRAVTIRNTPLVAPRSGGPVTPGWSSPRVRTRPAKLTATDTPAATRDDP